MLIRPGEVVIHDGNWMDFVNPVINGETKWCATHPRDWSVYPHGSLKHAKPFDLPLIPESEWESRLAARIAARAQFSDVRNTGMFGQPIPSLDQNGVGYCWCHSGVSAHLIRRAFMGEPFVDLSPFAIGCMIKGFRDEGGFGGEGVEFQGDRGCPTSEFWPQRSMSRSNDNPKTWENAKLHRYLGWRDLDPNNMKAQFISCLLLYGPCISDYDFWSHSVCAVDLVSASPLRVRIWNSWGDSWSDKGMGILEESKAIPNSAWVCLVTTASQG